MVRFRGLFLYGHLFFLYGLALNGVWTPPINLATFLFSILDSKRRLGTFRVFFGLILLILFSFLMALFLTGRLFVY